MVTNAALSGESVGDVVMLDYYFAVPGIKDGLFQPVDSFFDFKDPKWPTNLTKYGSYNGKMYGFIENNNTASGIYYNKTMFQRLGLTDPNDLIAQDKWNWESFLDIAKKATKDTDGDGVIDQWGITNDPGNLMRILIHSNGGALIEEKDGKMVYGNEDPKVIEAVRFYSDLINVNKVVAPYKAGETNDYNDSQTFFNGGKAAMVTGELWEGETRTVMTDKQGFVPFPKGPKRQDSWQGSIENYNAYYMPANVKRAEEKAYIWEQIQLWDRIEALNREAAEKQLLADEKDINWIVEMPKFSEPIFLPLNGTLTDVASSIARKGESPETALTRTKQVAQDGIDAIFAPK
jgi:multiple sugar transport system substrate-binding protein